MSEDGRLCRYCGYRYDYLRVDLHESLCSAHRVSADRYEAS